MIHISKIVFVLILIVLAGFVGFSLRTETVEAPIENVEAPVNTDEQNGEEIVSPTQTSEVSLPAGVTRDLSNQGIREVPRSEFERRDTEVLNLRGNNLTSLQAEIRQLSKLRSLDLSDNSLTNIPAELGQLSNLEVLNLRNNKLTGLPYELGNLKNLKTLDLRGNDYAKADLDIIKKSLPASAVVLVD